MAVKDSTTDLQYEKERRGSEMSFVQHYITWAKDALSQASKLAPAKASAKQLVNALLNETFRGEAAMDAEPRSKPRFHGYDLVDQMAQLCQDFIQSELESYLHLQERRGKPASKAVESLRAHASNIVELTRKSKWEQYVAPRLGGNHFDPDWVEKCWNRTARLANERVSELEDKVFLSGKYYPSTKPSLGDEIRRLRKSQNWTQQDLADKSGLPLRSIIDWENGKYGPSPNSISTLAGTFKVEESTFTSLLP
jgi:DNA-binding XRE family transcriptional regulator